jgi:predicted unusual protein kinase regulating ubiquinone biosynthesis (AarF/ABC1/UbiB family)
MSQLSQTQPDTTTTTDQASIPRPSAAPEFHPRKRFLRVSAFFLRVVLHIYIWDIFLSRFFWMRWLVRRTMMDRWVGLARHFRVLALDLGGMQIKLGQFLSSRADIVPEQVRRELAGLQDEVPPAPASHVLELIIEELGAPPSELFQRFESEAVAAASLGQVHFATLDDGREVAIKVQRPYIEKIIEVDLSALTWIVRLIKNYPPIRRRADLEALLAEFARVLTQELDYVKEARNGIRFRQNFAAHPGIYVPEPILEYTTRRVLVMERISGVKISDLRTLDELGINRWELAARLNNTYLKQFFLDGFFHADPHPGNLFVRVEPNLPVPVYTNGQHPPADGPHLPTLIDEDALPIDHAPEHVTAGTPFTLIFVDFGMVGELPADKMSIVRGGVVGLATNDAERIVEALDRLNMILPGAERRPIVQAMETLMRFSYNLTVRELNNMDVEALFDETRGFVYDLPFQIPQDLLYLGRAVSMVGGLATEICPDINLFAELRPFARLMIEHERNGESWTDRLQKELTDIGQILVKLPRQMDEYYRAANRGELRTQADFSRLERGIRRVERSSDRLTGGVLAASLFLGSVQLRTRGLVREADQTRLAALAAAAWAFWPRNNDR